MGLSYLQEQTLRSDLDAQRPVKCKRKVLPTLQLGSAAARLVASYRGAFTSGEDAGGECLQLGAF